MKTVLITGASSGIGAALAVKYAQRGDRIALLARRGDLLEEVAAAVRQAGGTPLVVPCDVIDKASVHAAVDRAREEWGAIDLAIANAGVSRTMLTKEFDADAAELIIRTNVIGMLYLFDAVVPDMIARRSGHFAGVASLAGFRAVPTSAVYSASKSAMQTFLEGARMELKRKGVSVTTINPGFVETPMTSRHKFKMPFLMKVDRAATIIVAGLDAKKREINFPLPTTLVMRLVRALPNSIYEAAMRFSPKR